MRLLGTRTVGGQCDNETKCLSTAGVGGVEVTLVNCTYDFEDNYFVNILAVAEILHVESCQLLCRWGR